MQRVFYGRWRMSAGIKLLRFIHIKQIDRKSPRVLQTIAMLLMVCSGLPAYGLELPDRSKPGAAEPGRQVFEPKPPVMPDLVPAAPKQELIPGKGNQARVKVLKIDLLGVVERPELGINKREITAFVEKLRKEKIAEEHKRLLDMLRLKSLEDSSNLLKKIEKIARDAEHEEDRKILDQAIAQFRSRESLEDTLSLQQLQEIAASVAQYYRERGFILVQTFIPPQTINGGIVQIRVMEGILGHVTIEKKDSFSEEQLLEPFRGLSGQPVIKQRIEEAMLLLNDYPGLKTFAVFRPGIFTGETDLLVSVVEEDRGGANLHVDNYGSVYTGEQRARFDIFVNNPFRLNDRIIASVSQTINPDNGDYLGLVYEKRALGAKNLFSFNFSSNKYKLGAELKEFGITGKSSQTGVSWRHSLQRGRLYNSYSLLSLNMKSAELNIVEGNDREDKLAVISGEFGFNWSDAGNQHSASGWIQVSQGMSGLLGSMDQTDANTLPTSSRKGRAGGYATSDFTKFAGDFHYWTRLQQDQLLHLSLKAQQSSDLLTSLEQMPIGGPGSVRAYSTSEYLRDTAFSTSLEWIVKAPGFAERNAFGNKRWGEILDAVLFVDYAKGWLNDPLANEEETVDLTGIGAGLRMNYKDFSARFELATPVGGEDASNGEDPQYYFELNIGF